MAFLCEVDAEPKEIHVVIAGGLIKRDEQCVGFIDRGRVEGLANEFIALGERERREFDSVVIVEGEEGFDGGADRTYK